MNPHIAVPAGFNFIQWLIEQFNLSFLGSLADTAYIFFSAMPAPLVLLVEFFMLVIVLRLALRTISLVLELVPL